MHKRINNLFFIVLCIAFSPCLSTLSSAQDPPATCAIDSVQKEKELLARRTQLAQMESDILAYQRRQLDNEMRDISRLTKEVAAKERQLQAQHKEPYGAQSVRDILKQKLEQQNSLLAQARKNVEEERKNLDLRIGNLKAELERQELERRNFLLEAAQDDAQRKEKQRIANADALRKDLQSCRQVLSRKEQERRELEAARDARHRQILSGAQEQKKQLLLQQEEMDRIIREEKRSAGGQSLQARLDGLLDKQQKLLNISRQVEQDLRRQKEDVQTLLDRSRAEPPKEGAK